MGSSLCCDTAIQGQQRGLGLSSSTLASALQRGAPSTTGIRISTFGSADRASDAVSEAGGACNTISILAFGWSVILTTAVCLGEKRAPHKVPVNKLADKLVDKGLIRLGSVWICREEAELRRQLATLPELDFRQARHHEKKLIEAQFEMQNRLRNSRKDHERIRTALNQASLSAGQRQSLEDESRTHANTIAGFQTQIRNRGLDGFDEASQLTHSVLRLNRAQHRLALAILAADRSRRAIAERYAALAADPEIGHTLDQLGQPRQRLGPVKKYTVLQSRRWKKLRDAVFSDRVPLYRRSDRFRFSGIINESTLATFSYTGRDERAFIPASLAESARLEFRANAPTEAFVYQGRNIPGQKCTIPSLRIGKFVLRNVDVLVLAPEGEDLGARLTAATLKPYRVVLDAQRMRLRLIEPRTTGQ